MEFGKVEKSKLTSIVLPIRIKFRLPSKRAKGNLLGMKGADVRADRHGSGKRVGSGWARGSRMDARNGHPAKV